MITVERREKILLLTTDLSKQNWSVKKILVLFSCLLYQPTYFNKQKQFQKLLFIILREQIRLSLINYKTNPAWGPKIFPIIHNFYIKKHNEISLTSCSSCSFIAM